MYCELFLNKGQDTLTDAEAVESKLLSQEMTLSGQDGIKEEEEQVQAFLLVDSRFTRVREQIWHQCVKLENYRRDRIPPRILEAIKPILGNFPQRTVYSNKASSLLVLGSKPNFWDSGHFEIAIGMWGKGRVAPTWAALEKQARERWVKDTTRSIEEGIAKLECCKRLVELACEKTFDEGTSHEISVRTWL